LWVLFNIFAKKGKQPNQKNGSPGVRPLGRQPATLPPSTGMDPTQQEGAGLQDLLRELGRTLDEAARRRPNQPKMPNRPPAKAPVRKSPEAAGEARSLEDEVQRPERAVVDTDDEAEAIAARRIAAAEANVRPLGAADHLAFDARIRQEPADATATKG